MPPSTSTSTCCSAGCRTPGTRRKCVRNVTDVDDDILRKSRELGVHYLDLAAEEMARFDAEMGMLNLLPVYSEPRATSAISEILSLIGAALDAGHAYESGGSVYFDVAQLPPVRSDQRVRPVRNAGAGCRARRQSRRSPQAGPVGLRAVAAVAARRAGLGVTLGSRAAGLAHRVLGAGAARAGGDGRHPRRGTRPGLPPSRVRDGAVRGGDRASRSSGCGSTSAWSAWVAPRCRSRWATWSSSASCARSGSRRLCGWPCWPTTTARTGTG